MAGTCGLSGTQSQRSQLWLSSPSVQSSRSTPSSSASGSRPASLGYAGAAGPRPITQSELATALALASTPESSSHTPTPGTQVTAGASTARGWHSCLGIPLGCSLGDPNPGSVFPWGCSLGDPSPGSVFPWEEFCV